MKTILNFRSALCYVALLFLSACADAPTTRPASAPLAGEKKCTVSEPVAGTLVPHRTCTTAGIADPAPAKDTVNHS